ncbi:MAG: 6-chlorohydroxyquinol-1,2-dioxygenase [Rhodobacterales bacterium RIFCSPHIGHO2_02_FULL_62_130]|nr:MAG: 6-chlorohydroxyquinol-1,2-dioxygenase [Rhodobacterales bacterium RIFCSPHIGHO2_02_FULL_62_130]OHC60178.1 MAG: 6-chlorohydroxyquinol-1,2-dioxygenase [Rhodobacterales bacterium RIFCSPHIGHO2_12_FULL_62_75]HCY98884.1 6-chlorohydroxyquinol-1,2-dioxygenase [Rhodobacter sp.]
MTANASTGYFTEEASVQTVNARMGPSADARLARVMASLVSHLHAFVKDVALTQDEWSLAIDFLTRTGKICDENRQEYILLSDVLGVSMLVDAINNRRPQGATENTVLGPFHVDGVPEYPMGASITKDGGRETCLFEGTVTDLDGTPLEGVRIDVWSDNEDGFYDVQQPGVQPAHNNRGVFVTGEDGRYWFQGIRPVSYPIPDDGPVGQLLAQLGRHPYRPAHMHFIISRDGFETVITHTFVAGDAYLDSDAVFGVKQSLIATFVPVQDGETKWRSTYDFVLQRRGVMQGTSE